MSLFHYTTLHDIKEICNIYRGSWLIKYWNFTDQKCMHLQFNRFDWVTDTEGSHLAAYFDTCDHETSLDNLGGWRELFGDYWRGSYDHEYAEVIILNKKGKSMRIHFTGSSNYDPDRLVNFNIDYVDENYHKIRREIYWFGFKLKYKFNKLCENLFHTKTKE